MKFFVIEFRLQFSHVQYKIIGMQVKRYLPQATRTLAIYSRQFLRPSAKAIPRITFSSKQVSENKKSPY